MIMEAEKFHDLSSAPWRPREASGIYSSSPNPRPESQEHKSPRAEEMDIPTQEKATLPFLHLYCSIQAVSGWNDAHQH